MVVYLGRCPRLYTAALSARVAHAVLRLVHTGLPTVSWSLYSAISLGLREALASRVAHSGLRMGFVENVGVVIGSLKVGLLVSRDGHGNGYGHSSRYRNGSQAARAESAAVYSLGQRPRYRSPVGNARCRRKSSRRRYHCRTARNRGDIRLYNVGISTFPQHNAYGYFYRKQAAPRPSEQAHGARLALLLRLQRDNSLMVVYLGRCPRL